MVYEPQPQPLKQTTATATPNSIFRPKPVDVAGAGGSYVLPAATTAEIGGVKKMPAQADSAATDAAGVVTDLNALLAKLRAAGILS